ncbi:MAG: hypothetical protein GY744_03005 [Gammaproteobacteria bacterium]|nr:hypothetical protein [Gammaproteobacteria bacterium]
MGTDMKTMLFLCCFCCASSLIADQNSDENRLLKSWGFQFNTQGKLIFSIAPQKNQQYLPWSPDLSSYKPVNPAKNPPKTIDPLVISSKSKPDQ